MKALHGSFGGLAIAVLLAFGNPAQAAWCNVFQVCCNSCNDRPATSYYAAPSVSYYQAPTDCCQPCQECTTRYIARCYYQPVTTYQTRSYYEPVTTYRTSYYWEPVTSYRYSMYYDPCSCSYKQQACPTTSYRLRSRCCPVQSWVQRCTQVPVTTYQQSYYYEPVTSCTSAAPPPCPPSGSAPAATPAPPAATPDAGVYEQRTNPPANGATPNVGEYRDGGRQSFSGSPSNAYQNPSQLRPIPQASPSAPAVPPTARLDRIASGKHVPLSGTLVSSDASRPQPQAQLLFINADTQGGRQTATTDAQGGFRVSLPDGGWLVYVKDASGKLVFLNRKIEVRNDRPYHVLLTSR